MLFVLFSSYHLPLNGAMILLEALLVNAIGIKMGHLECTPLELDIGIRYNWATGKG